MKLELIADRQTLVQYRGSHNNVGYLIQQHAFQDETPMLCKSTWCTYVLLSPEQHESFKGRIDGAPWNGGQTFYKEISEKYVDAPGAAWAKPSTYFKVGDDFNHLWDNERQDRYNRAYMERHIKEVIDYITGTGEP